MVSWFPHRSQFGSGLLLDLCALLFVQMVLFRTWKIISFVFDVRDGWETILYASVNVRLSGRSIPSRCRVL